MRCASHGMEEILFLFRGDDIYRYLHEEEKTTTTTTTRGTNHTHTHTQKRNTSTQRSESSCSTSFMFCFFVGQRIGRRNENRNITISLKPPYLLLDALKPWWQTERVVLSNQRVPVLLSLLSLLLLYHDRNCEYHFQSRRGRGSFSFLWCSPRLHFPRWCSCRCCRCGSESEKSPFLKTQMNK